MTYYYLIIALQILCAYHVYKSRNETYWYFVILLIPAIGCIIYILTQMLNRNDVAVIQKEITNVVVPSKKVKDLEAKLAFSETFQNQVNLADAYKEMGAFAKAETHYSEALTGTHSSDFHANSQLLQSLYALEKYNEVIAVAEKLKPKFEFEGSQAQFTYGLALSKLDKKDEAITVLSKIDKRYSNYEERLKLAKFYVEIDQNDKATELLESLLSEYGNMTKPNRKLHRLTFKEISELNTTLHN